MMDVFIILLTIPIFLLISFIIVLIVFIINSKVKQYKSESYYRITNNSYFNVMFSAGKHGEYLTYKNIMVYETMGAKFLFNIYIPKKYEETTEIDVLMISRKGLFVFESKNYSGWIFGSEDQKYWYQTLPSGRKSHKEKFYNPIFQNNTHIKYIKSLVGSNIPMFSIITFSDRCTLKNVNVQNINVYIIYRYQVYDLVTSIYNNTNDILTDSQVEDIYNKLYPYTKVNEIVKAQHVSNIINNTNNVKTDFLNTGNSLYCPDCGSKLVLRTAKRGTHAGEQFYGCSNYPKCRYIKKNTRK